MFCIKCGAELPDYAEFCNKCGTKVYTAKEQSAPAQSEIPVRPNRGVSGSGAPPKIQAQNIPAQEIFGRNSVKQRPKWLIPLVVGCLALAALVILAGIWMAMGGGNQEPVEAPASSRFPAQTPNPAGIPFSSHSSTEAPNLAEEKSELLHYENQEVMFSLDYPASFSLSEPNINNLLLGVGDRCRVAVEYAFYTTKNCFIYSADDFAEQIKADPDLLSDWIGAENVVMSNQDPIELCINGHNCRLFNWKIPQDEKLYTGGLYIFDAKGEFGCYTFMWIVEQGAEDEEFYTQQAMDMLNSFQITGSYQPEGYTVYECAEPDYLRFVLRDERIQGKIELGYENHLLNNFIRIHPAAEGRSQIGMYLPSSQRASSDPEKDNFSSAMDLAVGTFFSDSDYKDARFISQLIRPQIGRYPFVELGVQCRYTGLNDDEEQIRYVFIFPRSGRYWKIELIATAETLEQTSRVLMDFLMSLRVEDDCLEFGEDAFGSLSKFRLEDYQSSASQGDVNVVIDEILTKVESTSGFIKENDYYQPLASFTDVDSNGVNELLVLYKVKQKNPGGADEFKALYDIYAVNSDGSYSSVVIGQTLYNEVGGNSGTLGIVVDKAKTPYLKLETRSPQGDRFNNTVIYIPWGGNQTKLENEWVYLESHGTYGEEDKGQYILGDQRVDHAAFEARQTEFMSLWTDLNLNSGHGNGGNNMSFSQIRSMDMNTYKFNSV